MKLEQIETLAGRIAKVGVSGALPKDGPQNLLVDALQRQLSSLADATRAVLEDLRQSPSFAPGSNLFLIDCRPGLPTSNILSTTQATAEGLGATEGLAIFRHGLGYVLDRSVEVFFGLQTRSIGVVNGQQSRSGRVVAYAGNRNMTVFQVDDDAQVQEAVIVLSCYSGKPVPSAAVRAQNVTNGGADELVIFASQPGSEFP